MTDEQIEAVWNTVDASDLDVHDRKFAMKLRCRFARAIEQASRRAALEEACSVIMQPGNMSYFWGEAKGADHCAEEIAKQIRALSGPTET